MSTQSQARLTMTFIVAMDAAMAQTLEKYGLDEARIKDEGNFIVRNAIDQGMHPHAAANLVAGYIAGFTAGMKERGKNRG